MSRLDEEMQINTFLFRTVKRESSEEKKSAQGSNNTVADNADNANCDEKTLEEKKEYILRRAQIAVYKYSKRKERLRRILLLSVALLILWFYLVFYLIYYMLTALNRAKIFLGIVLIIIGALLIIFIVYERTEYRRLTNLIEEIYSMTVQFQMNAGRYNQEDENLSMYVEDLEECIGADRRCESDTKAK